MMKKLFKYDGTSINFALLIIRVGIGVIMMVHGYPKIIGGTEKWEGLGSAMENVGVEFFPVFWGFMAAFAEFFGGLMLVLGFLHIAAAFLLAFTMLIAFLMHFFNGDSFGSYSQSLKLLVIFVGLMFSGPGKFSIDYRLFK